MITRPEVSKFSLLHAAAESSNDLWGNDKPEDLEAGYKLATDVEQIIGSGSRTWRGDAAMKRLPNNSDGIGFRAVSGARRGTRAFTLQHPRAAIGTSRREASSSSPSSSFTSWVASSPVRVRKLKS
jgi:hypothetical protein